MSTPTRQRLIQISDLTSLGSVKGFGQWESSSMHWYEDLPDSPRELGLPQTQWRAHQREVALRAYYSKKPVVFLTAPTGAGKSLIALGIMALANANAERTFLATKTIQLQAQYIRDFPNHLYQVMGKSNYACIEEPDEDAGNAKCNYGEDCELKGTSNCVYYAARWTAHQAANLVGNYDYLSHGWAGRNAKKSPLHERSVLIGDEAHLADDSLRSAVSVDFTRQNIKAIEDHLHLDAPESTDLGIWLEYCGEATDRAMTLYGDMDDEEKPRPLIRALDKIDRFRSLVTQYADQPLVTDWNSETGSFTVQPVFPDAMFRSLMDGFDKIILMSATLPSPSILASILGLLPDEYEAIEVPSPFPASNRPLFVHRQAPRVSKRMSDNDLRRLIHTLDFLIDQAPGDKGIIHTHAYWLQQEVLHRSRHTARFITHGSRGLAGAVAQFEAAPAGYYLVSPTAHSGVDLPYEHVRQQFILKIPYPDLGDNVIKARQELMPETYPLATAATLIQAVGRGMRAVDDHCDTHLLDGNWSYFYSKARDMLPAWFREAIIPR